MYLRARQSCVNHSKTCYKIENQQNYFVQNFILNKKLAFHFTSKHQCINHQCKLTTRVRVWEMRTWLSIRTVRTSLQITFTLDRCRNAMKLINCCYLPKRYYRSINQVSKASSQPRGRLIGTFPIKLLMN